MNINDELLYAESLHLYPPRPHRPSRWVWRRHALHLQADPLAGYKAVVPRRFSVNPLHPFLLLHFSDVSCLWPLASSTFPPILPCGPPAPQKDTTKPVRRMPAGCYSLEVSAALSR